MAASFPCSKHKKDKTWHKENSRGRSRNSSVQGLQPIWCCWISTYISSWCPWGYWSTLQWAKGFPALRNCKCASLIVSLAQNHRQQKMETAKTGWQRDDWVMVQHALYTKATYMRPNEHHQAVPAILCFSDCKCRLYSEVPDSWQIIPNRTKCTLLSDAVIEHH